MTSRYKPSCSDVTDRTASRGRTTIYLSVPFRNSLRPWAIWMRQPSFQRRQLSRIALPLLVAGTGLFVLELKHPLAEAAFSYTVCNLASAGLLSCALLTGTSAWSFLVDRPVLKFLGFVSYGLYLIHVLAFRLAEILFARPLLALQSAGNPTAAMLLRFAAGSGLAIAVAYLSRRSLEDKFLRMGFASRSAHRT